MPAPVTTHVCLSCGDRFGSYVCLRCTPEADENTTDPGEIVKDRCGICHRELAHDIIPIMNVHFLGNPKGYHGEDKIYFPRR